jgi:hypothetical protein
MRKFHNLHDEGRSAPTLRQNNLRAVAREHVQVVAAARHTPSTPLLIATGAKLKKELTRSKQRRKYFLIATFSDLFAIRRAGSEEFVLAAVVWQSDDFLEAQAEFIEQGDGGLIGGLGDGDDALEAQLRPAVVHHSGGGFARVALRPVLSEEREADVYILERFAFEQAADADGGAGVFQVDEVQAKSESAVAGDGAFGDVAPRVREGAGAAIADIFEEGGFVQEFEDERGVARGEVPQKQPFCFENFHCGDVSIFSGRAQIISATAMSRRDEMPKCRAVRQSGDWRSQASAPGITSAPSRGPVTQKGRHGMPCPYEMQRPLTRTPCRLPIWR